VVGVEGLEPPTSAL